MFFSHVSDFREVVFSDYLSTKKKKKGKIVQVLSCKIFHYDILFIYVREPCIYRIIIYLYLSNFHERVYFKNCIINEYSPQ